MSRLPLMYAGKPISFRVPYSMAAELDVPPSTFGTVYPDASFMVQIDKPFEIHRVMVRLIALGNASETWPGAPTASGALTIIAPQPSTLESCIRLNIIDQSKNEKLTRSPTLVSLLLNLLTGAWDLEEPYTLVRSEGFNIAVDTLSFPPAVVVNSLLLPEFITTQLVRVAISMQGYLVVIAPPSETR